MKNVKIVIGANYGDEGKGLLTNYFCGCSPSSAPLLNVRFNGGAQAGHTVVFRDGRRHVFHHFGSGSFYPDVVTCLAPMFVLNPMIFCREWKELDELGVRNPTVHLYKTGNLSLPMDMMINQFIEEARGASRHGSCGVGINEAIVREESLRHICPFTPERYLRGLWNAETIRDDILNATPLWGYYKQRMCDLGLTLNAQQTEWFNSPEILYAYACDLMFMLEHTKHYAHIGEEFYQYNEFVFEGAQGLLLDKDRGVHTTPSHTGLEYTMPWFALGQECNIEVCYVTRPYFTRHGAGPFRTECNVNAINEDIIDRTNQPNDWQGTFRYGYFDVPEFILALNGQHQFCEALKEMGHTVKEAIACTHVNETTGRIALGQHWQMPISFFETLIGMPIAYTSAREDSVDTRDGQ